MNARLATLGLCAGLLVSLRVRAEAPSAQAQARADKPVEAAPAAAPDALQPPENIEQLIFFSQRPGREPSPREQKAAALLDKLVHERERLVKQRRARAIDELTRFISQEPESVPEMADALLRLAELRWEQARARYVEQYAAWQKAPAAVRSKRTPTEDVTVALDLYDRILTRHRDFARYDLVLYMKAFALMEAGRMGDALVEYQRILDEFPSSRFCPDAHMAFAESLFNGSHDYAGALARYEQVLRYPQSELSDLALFKSAWCLWKLGRVKRAATRFREVLDLGVSRQKVSAERRKRLLELQDEALEYLIQVFTEDEHNTAADLHRFLTGIGGEKYAGRVLRRLSRTFFDQARYARAVEAYQMLLQSEPDAADAPQYQRQIARGYAALEDAEHTIAALRALAENYGPKTPWAAKQADPEAVSAAQKLAERAVRTRAMRYHERAQKEHQNADFERAAALYRVYIEHFPDESANYEVTFYLAEILFHRLKQPAAAGEYYLKAARKNPKGKYTKDALYNAIVAFEHVREKELAGCDPSKETAAAPPPSAPKKAGQDAATAQAGAASEASPNAAQPPPSAPAASGPHASDPCKETDTDHKFSEAVAMYVQLYPNDPQVPGILFRQGRMYFDRGIYDPAIRQFGQLLDSYPNSEYASTAGELVLESFNRARDYGNIERWARKLKTAPAFQNAQSQKKLDALILQSVFKLGEQLASSGEHAKAAQAYLRATQEFPRDERAPKAYYNAGQEWQRAGDLQAAAEAYDVLIEHYPGSREGALGALSAAHMFESIAQFKDAARYYEAYAERFPKADKREDAYYNALLLRIAAGDNAQAVSDGTALLKAYPSGASADEVYFLIGKAYEADGRYAQAARTYRHYIKRGAHSARAIEAQTRLGKVLLAQGDRDGADRALSLAAKGGRTADDAGARYSAAEARFLQGDQALAEFEKVKIAGDVAGLKKRLARKSELLRKAAEIYGDVVEYRVSEWVTAALYKIGKSYELFAESLRAAPVPPNLSEREEQAYHDQLAQFIVPIEERALQAYESGYHKALELHVFNSWTQKQREALTRLNEVEYPPLKEAGAGLSQTQPLPMPNLLDGLRRGEAAQTGSRPPATRGRARARGGRNAPRARAEIAAGRPR